MLLLPIQQKYLVQRGAGTIFPSSLRAWDSVGSTFVSSVPVTQGKYSISCGFVFPRLWKQSIWRKCGKLVSNTRTQRVSPLGSSSKRGNCLLFCWIQNLFLCKNLLRKIIYSSWQMQDTWVWIRIQTDDRQGKAPAVFLHWPLTAGRASVLARRDPFLPTGKSAWNFRLFGTELISSALRGGWYSLPFPNIKDYWRLLENDRLLSLKKS